ncbi:MAG: DUF2651 family protein [Clostridia bacterium]|nr:DUF2651 family protein [Clostridia bacterium]
MNLFIFFALPLATILLAIVFQKILRSPILVAITFFAIYLIVAFVAFSDTLAEAIIAAIIYTIIAYITAYIVMIICRLRRRFCHCRREEAENNRRCGCGNNNDNNENAENNLLRISCSCGNSDRSSDLLTIDSTCMANDTNNLTDETATLSNSNVATGRQYVSRPVAYGNQRCYRRI